MRRGYTGEAGSGNGLEFIYPQPLLVDRDMDDLCPGGGQAKREARVVRLFEDHGVAGVDQQAHAKIDRLLRTLHDQHLLGFADNTSPAREVVGEG
jgi:hypothetical protein